MIKQSFLFSISKRKNSVNINVQEKTFLILRNVEVNSNKVNYDDTVIVIRGKVTTHLDISKTEEQGEGFLSLWILKDLSVAFSWLYN